MNITKKCFWALIVTLSLAMVSCKDAIDSDLQWRSQSEQRFDKYKNDSQYKRVSTSGILGDNFVMMKYIKKGEGKVHPIHTSRVLLHYQQYILGIENPIASNYSSEEPDRFSLNRGADGKNLPLGMRIALMNMVEGDEAEVIIPWYLGYGENSKPLGIMNFSALRYIVRLDKIIPENDPD